MEDDEAAAEESENETDEFAPAATIDVDAIASAKSLGEAMRLLAPQLEGLPRRSRGKYGKRKNLSPEAKAELTRERNRENAKSTRMRRKMYIKHLQEVAERLQIRHDELNAKMSAPPPDDYSKMREAARRFFELRGHCETSDAAWLRVVEPDVELTLPPSDDLDFRRRVRGAAAVVDDCRSLDAFLRDLAVARRNLLTHCHPQQPTKPKKRQKKEQPGCVQKPPPQKDDDDDDAPPRANLVYRVDPASIVHLGTSYMCQWTATISLVELDAPSSATTCTRPEGGNNKKKQQQQQRVKVSFSQTGMAKCTFSTRTSCIATIDLRYDNGAFSILAENFTSALRFDGLHVENNCDDDDGDDA